MNLGAGRSGVTLHERDSHICHVASCLAVGVVASLVEQRRGSVQNDALVVRKFPSNDLSLGILCAKHGPVGSKRRQTLRTKNCVESPLWVNRKKKIRTCLTPPHHGPKLGLQRSQSWRPRMKISIRPISERRSCRSTGRDVQKPGPPTRVLPSPFVCAAHPTTSRLKGEGKVC